MRAHIDRPAGMPIWIAGISLCMLTAVGLVAIARAIPDSYAGIPDARAGEPQARPAGVQATSNRQIPVRCAECGVIESMRQIVPPGAAARRGVVDVGVAANAVTASAYETTVRFRDGRTAVFNEASPRAWRSGSRVIVIGGYTAPND